MISMRQPPIITREMQRPPARADDAHKGEVGRVAVIGGCDSTVTMIGAPALTGSAAFRSGAGLVQLIVPRTIQLAVARLVPCATSRAMPGDPDGLVAAVLDFAADAVAFGVGLGDSLPRLALEELINDFAGPMVIDADGLALLGGIGPARIRDPRRIVITPHPGEMRTLLKARSIDLTLDRSAESRRAAALAAAQAYRCTVVLKGRGTVVTDGARLAVNETGNSGMASGGTGDVLTGVVAALLAAKMEPLEAAILAAHVHGLAGDFAAEEKGRLSLTATDVVDFLPEAFQELEPEEG
jgi:NAD(P)H-hydrate epimerase